MLEGPNEKYWTIVTFDCQESLVKLVARRVPTDADTLRDFDKIAARRLQDETFFDTANRLGTVVTSRLVAFIYGIMVASWEKSLNAYVDTYRYIKETYPDAVSPTGDNLARWLHYVMEFQESLCLIQKNTSNVSSYATSGAGAAKRLSNIYSEEKQKEDQLRALNMALGFSVYEDREKRLRWIEECLDLAMDVGNQTMRRNLLFQALQLSLVLSETKSEYEIKSFDLCERAILFNHLERGDSQFIDLLGRAIKENRDLLSPLYPLYLTVKGEIPNDVKDYMEKVVGILGNNILSALQEIADILVDDVREYLVLIENHRLKILQKQDKKAAMTFWNNWSIDYPGIHRAVPFGDSLTRDSKKNRFVLTVCHELIHVQTFMSTIGVGLQAMRWSLNQILYSQMPQIEEWSELDAGMELDERLRNKEMIINMPPNVFSFLMAHQHLELQYKIKVMQEVWWPWLEGVAVFGELGGDPTDDKDAYHVATQVLYNMIDTGLRGSNSVDAAREAALKMEHLYSEAIKKEGPHRLRYYLDNEWKHYLPGYLLIRKIISTWRNKLDDTLSGCSALRILLTVTRQSSRTVIPDLTLSPADFKESCIQNFNEFVNSVLSLSGEDIGRIKEAYVKSSDDYKLHSVFENGKFREAVSPESIEEQHLEWIGTIAKQTLSMVPIQERYQEQFEKTGQPHAIFLGITAEALTERFSNAIFGRKQVIQSAFNRMSVVVIGQTTATFWLIENTKVIAFYHRVIETEPSYSLSIRTLDEKDFNEVRKELQRLKYNRLRVTRLADMSPPSLESDGQVRGGGDNFITLQYGNWMATFPGGLKIDSDKVPKTAIDPINMRLNPNEFLRYFDWYTSTEQPMTKQLIKWMEDLRDWEFDPTGGDLKIDFSPFRDEFLPLARLLASGTTEVRDEVNNAILERMFGKSDVVNEGLRIANSNGLNLFSKLIDFLQESARFPVTNKPDWLGDIDEILPGFIARSKHGYDVKPYK